MSLFNTAEEPSGTMSLIVELQDQRARWADLTWSQVVQTGAKRYRP